jgi:hypothetical protein
MNLIPIENITLPPDELIPEEDQEKMKDLEKRSKNSEGLPVFLRPQAD